MRLTAPLVLLVAALLPATVPPAAARGPEMSAPCTARLQPGDDLAAALTDGAVVCLAPGVHHGHLFIEHSLTVQAEPGAVLDAGGAGSAVHIAGDGLRVRLVGLELTRGRAELGAGLLVEGDSDVEAVDLHIHGNTTPAPGAGVGVLRGRLKLQGGRVQDEVLITLVGDLEVQGTALDGGLVLREHARATLGPGSTSARTDLRGGPRRAPTLRLQGGDPGDVRNDPRHPGVVEGG